MVLNYAEIQHAINKVCVNSLYGSYVNNNNIYREQKELTGDKIGVFQYVKLNLHTTKNDNCLKKDTNRLDLNVMLVRCIAISSIE